MSMSVECDARIAHFALAVLAVRVVRGVHNMKGFNG